MSISTGLYCTRFVGVWSRDIVVEELSVCSVCHKYNKVLVVFAGVFIGVRFVWAVSFNSGQEWGIVFGAC